jgi:apolipoprotein N-acyltransferase
LAIVAGFAMAASFPNLNVAGLAWIAPALFLAAALGKSGGEAFRIGYVAGLAHYLISLYWLLHIPYRWHGIPFGPAAGWVALSGFLALFPATWVWTLSKASRKPGTPGTASPTESPGGTLLEATDAATPRTWLGRATWSLAGAALWVGLEMVLARIFGGFPWNLLGVSQERLLPLLQIASITGIYGVSFVIVWFSMGLLSAGLNLARKPNSRAAFLGEIILPALTVALLFNVGLRQIRNSPPPTRLITVTLIQPSIPQTLIWDASTEDARFQRMLALCDHALSNRTDLLIWPESGIPKLLRYDKVTYEAVTGLARRHHIWMIVGADDAEPRPSSAGNKEADFFNSSFLISPDGELVANYKKQSLVIFGEYIPLVRWLPFVKWFTPIESGFTPGDKAVQFVMPALGFQTSVLICFEDVFAQFARKAVQKETDFLVNITNDGWFGNSAAQWQQAFTALPRAIENRRPLIRCTNNGVTCWFDSYGRMHELFRDASGSVYGAGYLRFELPLPGANQALTFYSRHGDWFGWSCFAVGVTLVLARLRPRFRSLRARLRRAVPAGGP